MESKNPLEEIREAILESQKFGIKNEISQLGVSEELLKISDALDDYYDIKRQPECNTIEILGGFNKKSPLSIESIERDVLGYRFGEVRTLLNQVKEPLKSMRRKLSKDNPIYINLSSAIVSIAVRKVVSSINSYQKPNNYDSWRSNYSRYDLITGIDIEYKNLIWGGLRLFNDLSEFDMTQECFDNYEANRNILRPISEKIFDAMAHPRSNMQKSSSSGCLVLTLTISTSLVAFLALFVLLFV